MATPGESEGKDSEEENAVELTKEEAFAFRSIGARANYLSQDRPDIAYAVKEVCRSMSSPTIGSMKALKRLGRYLIKHPRMVFRYDWQGREPEITAFSDSDWAGCRTTGKSTSGGCVLRGTHYLKGWSKTQQCVTLSSAEAELVAMNKAAAELLGILSMYTDLGEQARNPAVGYRGSSAVSGEDAYWNLSGVICGDSSAALAISNRRGVGKLRHIHIGQLWIQERIQNKDLAIKKVPGTENPSDMFTKHLSESKRQNCCNGLAVEERDGRAKLGLQVQQGRGHNDNVVVCKLTI